MVRKILGMAVLFGSTFCSTTVFACVAPSNANIEASLSKDLAKYKAVTVTVDDCIATLNGQVERLSDKMAAAHKAAKYDALDRVVNNIAVVTPFVEDDKLVSNVSEKLRRDRERTGALMSFLVSAHDGEVTVSGLAYTPMNRDEALSVVAGTRGVRQLVDMITVSPVASLYPYLENPHSIVYGYDCVGSLRSCYNAH